MAFSPESEHPIKAYGYAARDTSGTLSPLTFSRRATGDKDVRFKVLYCGICHSDLHFAKNEWGMSTYPLVPGNLTEFPTAKMLWDALTVTCSSGKDKLQTFDLHGIWGEIKRRDPNPMTCPIDIAAYNKIMSENKLFQFLHALDRKYDPIKREILRWDPLPTAEAAYVAVRKKTAHQNILGGTQQGVTSRVKLTDDLDRIGLVSNGRRSDQKFNSSSS
nr:hypothetical protein [Tanacetum cinerariifolium]